MPFEAVAHAAAAGDFDTVARLLVEYHLAADQERRQPDVPALGSRGARRAARPLPGTRRRRRGSHRSRRRECAGTAPLPPDRGARGPEVRTYHSIPTSRAGPSSRERSRSRAVSYRRFGTPRRARRARQRECGGGSPWRARGAAPGRSSSRASSRRRRPSRRDASITRMPSGARRVRCMLARRSRSSRSSVGGCQRHGRRPNVRRPPSAGSGRPGAGSARTRPRHSVRCSRPRGACRGRA